MSDVPSSVLRVGMDSAVVSGRVAELILHACGADLTALLVRVRGIDPQATREIEGLRYCADQWRLTSASTEVAGSRQPAQDSDQIMQDMVKPPEAAALLKISRQAIWKAINEERLPVERNDSQVLIRREDIEHYRANRKAS